MYSVSLSLSVLIAWAVCIRYACRRLSGCASNVLTQYNIMHVSQPQNRSGAILPVVVNVSCNNDVCLCSEPAIWTCILILFLILKAFPPISVSSPLSRPNRATKTNSKHTLTYIYLSALEVFYIAWQFLLASCPNQIEKWKTSSR